MGFIIAFVVIFIIVLAFKKNSSTTTVIKKDEDGKETTETHVTETHSAGQTAARVLLGIIGAVVFLFMLVLCASSM